MNAHEQAKILSIAADLGIAITEDRFNGWHWHGIHESRIRGSSGHASKLLDAFSDAVKVLRAVSVDCEVKS